MINIIPRPNEVIEKEGHFYFDNSKRIEYNSLFPISIDFISSLFKTDMTDKDGDIVFQYNDSLDDSEYYLFVNNEKIVIEAKTDMASFYALESLRLLSDGEIENGASSFKIPCVEIHDKPDFLYRGFMIDVCRHFFSKEVIKRQIDLISMFKINTLHFHISDDQGFRLDIKKYPKIKEISTRRIGSQVSGLFFEKDKIVDDKEVSGFYTEEDISEIIEYANKHFVNVIPEIDMPGHFTALLSAYPEYSCKGKDISVQTKWGVFPEVLCLGNDEAFSFAYDLIKEILRIFKTDEIHIGGDECPVTSYKKCPKCLNRMKELGIKDVHKLQGYFTDRMVNKLIGEGIKVTLWNEAISDSLNRNARVQFWKARNKKDEKNVFKQIELGTKTIVSPFRKYYLDYVYQLYTLEETYKFNPRYPDILSKEAQKNIVGVEGPLWTEWVDSENRIDFQVYPRLVAISESAWTKEENKDWDNFLQRLDELNKRFDLIGVCYSPKDCYMQKKIKFNLFNVLFKLLPMKEFPGNTDYKKYRGEIDEKEIS